MKLVIDIPEEYYNLLKGFDDEMCSMDMLLLKNGTPLDTHDEEIIAETVESIWGKPPYTELLDKIRAEIEQLLTYDDITGKSYFAREFKSDVLDVIDKYKTERAERGR